METVDLNVRVPNIDRFIEVMCGYEKMHGNVRFAIPFLPDKYQQIVNQIFAVNFETIQEITTSDIDNADFIDLYRNDFVFKWLFRQYEPIEKIQERIENMERDVDPALDETSKTLLKKANQIYGYTFDTIENVIRCSQVIAGLDNYDAIRPEHCAEATQYARETFLHEHGDVFGYDYLPAYDMYVKLEDLQ